MAPTLAFDREADRRPRHSVLPSKLGDGCSTSRDSVTHGENVGLGELGVGIGRSSNRRGTALRALVPVVISLSAEEQMVGIAAGRVVATVENVPAFGNGPVPQFPRDTMGEGQAPVLSYPPISMLEARTGPRPTSGPTFDLRPKGSLKLGPTESSHMVKYINITRED